jgi:hypothetical protein
MSAAPLIGLPLAAGLRGVVVSLVRLRPQWIPYFLCFVAYNYVALIGVVARALGGGSRGAPAGAGT